MTREAKFNLGDIVVHKQQGYRAVIVDIDPCFQASGRYNPQTYQRDFAHQNPWYRLLIDESSQMTYVEEPLLQADLENTPTKIKNPRIKDYQNKPMH